MLNKLYTEDIDIKIVASGNPSEGYTYSDDTIKGAIIQKTVNTQKENGVIVTTENILQTDSNLETTTRIVFDGRNIEIKHKNRVYDHFFGKVSHYEYLF